MVEVSGLIGLVISLLLLFGFAELTFARWFLSGNPLSIRLPHEIFFDGLYL